MNTPIIILNWNGIDDTIECVDSILMSIETSYHIYLVDNGSTNNEGELLLNRYQNEPHITVILYADNHGFTRGNNLVLNQLLPTGDSDFIVLLNNDTVVAPYWLKQLHKGAKEHNADVISCKMIDYYDRSIMDNAGHYMLNTGEILPIGHRRSTDVFDKHFQNVGACGGAAMYRVSMLREIGIFDEFFDTGYEDAELGLRAKLCGYKCIFEPNAVVYHKISRSVMKIRNTDYYIQVQRNILYTYTKLMSSQFLSFHLIWLVVKYLLFGILGVLFLRFKVLNHHLVTLQRFFKYDFKVARVVRKKFYQEHKVRVHNPTEFFLKTDIRRLNKFIKGGFSIG